MDLAHAGAEATREISQRRIDLMIPVIKGWLTEIGIEVTSLGIQVHGGMGYVEETGAAHICVMSVSRRFTRGPTDSAADLLNRKLGRDGGATMEAMHAEIREVATALQSHANPKLTSIGGHLSAALADHVQTTQRLLATLADDRFAAMGGSFDYMMQTGYLFGGWQPARGALVASELASQGDRVQFCERKINTALFCGPAATQSKRSCGRDRCIRGESCSIFFGWF